MWKHFFPSRQWLFLFACCAAIGIVAWRYAVSPPPFPGATGQAQLGSLSWRHVLYLNSYQNGYTWSDTILDGLRSGLEQVPYPIDLQVEYLDTKKYPLEATRDFYLELFRTKFGGQQFQTIVVSDNAAFDFIRAHGGELFPGVPVVFCGINDFQPEQMDDLPQATGVLEHVPVIETLEVARKLHPSRTRVHVVGDASITAQAIKAQVRDAASELQSELQFIYHNVNTFEALSDVIRRVRDNGLIFYVPFYLAESEHSFAAEEVLQFIADRTQAPIYTSWEFLMGAGALGGKQLDGKEQGLAAAGMVRQILDGVPAGQIPVQPKTVERFVFDYAVMQKLQVREGLLPENSRLINEPSPFYELDKQVFWTLMGSLVAMTVVLIILAQTIVQRRQVEQQVVDQLAFMRLLMDNIPQLVYWKDKKCRYLGANLSFVDFFQMGDPESVVGLSNRDLMSNDRYAVRGEEEDREVMSSNRAKYKMIWNVDRRDDVPVTLEVSKVPLHDKSGNVVGVLSSAEDITRRVNLERQLLQSQKMEAIGAFASGIAHDFNNLLTTITNSIELALLDIPKESDAANDAERALKAAGQGGDLVRQLLTYTRPTREGLEPTDVAKVVRDAASLVLASLPSAIRFKDDIPDELPLCQVNPAQIRQIVMNLCSNAYQAMKESGGNIEVRLDLSDVSPEHAEVLRLPPGPYLHLTVQDDGPGIPQEIIDKIFDPFFTTKDKGEGTGLGLAVVQGIVAAHKGAITLSSTPNLRTTFDIYLPYIEEENVRAAPPVDDAIIGYQTILFVEDNQDQLRTIPRALMRLGYTVHAFPDAQAALDALAAGPLAYDVVVTDFDMPGINGVEFARTLDQLFPGPPVIMVSGRSTAVEAARSVGTIKTVLHKPYSVGQLTREIQEATIIY